MLMQETWTCHPAAASHCLDKLSDFSAAVQRAAASSLPELCPCPGGPLATTTGHTLRAESRSQTRKNARTTMPCAFFPLRCGNRVCRRGNPEVSKKWRNLCQHNSLSTPRQHQVQHWEHPFCRLFSRDGSHQ